MAKPPPIRSTSNHLSVSIFNSNDNELVSPIPEPFVDTTKQEPIHVVWVFLAVRMHYFTDDFVIEERLRPDAGYGGEITELRFAEAESRSSSI